MNCPYTDACVKDYTYFYYFTDLRSLKVVQSSSKSHYPPITEPYGENMK